LCESHSEKLIPTRKTLLLELALIAAYALLEFVSREVLSELREDGLTKVHPSLLPVVPDRGQPDLLQTYGPKNSQMEKTKKPP
jgi:hypothetical protein